MTSNAEQKLSRILNDTRPQGPRWPVVAAMAAVILVLVAIAGYAMHASARGGPLLNSERAVLDGLVVLTTTSKRVKKTVVVKELAVYMNSVPLDRLTRADFEKARDWLIKRAGR